MQQISMPDAVVMLGEEQDDLRRALEGITDDQWLTPTPAHGWDVRDQVSHLADTEEIAYDTMTSGPRQLNKEALSFPSPEAFTESGCEKGRKMRGPDVLAWWVKGAIRTRQELARKDAKDRVPWGLGMSARSFVSARLMETWAHGLDVRAAVGAEPDYTPRLKDVAFLIVRALPYAFRVAQREPPPGELRVDLSFEDETWTYGNDDANNFITGEAQEFCRVGVQRLKRADTTTLKAEGDLADAFLDVARAFL